MKNANVFVVDNDDLIQSMFYKMRGKGYRVVHKIDEADIICFPGGADVCPELYGEKAHPSTHSSHDRDDRWIRLLTRTHIFDKNILYVGICGGGQFLNVMAGGRMWQDVDKHALAGTHMLTYHDKIVKGQAAWEDRYIRTEVTSTHHQMMRPNQAVSELWGYTLRTTHRDDAAHLNWPTDRQKDGPDVEIVWYPKENSLCFQPHPEYNSMTTCDLFFRCLERARHIINLNL